MMDAQIASLKTLLPVGRNILIALPQGSNIDKLSSGLALYLSLTQIGKNVSIVCEDTILVAQSHLFAIDKIQKTLPQANSGDFILTLEGVAANGVVPSLEKEDYYVEGNNLNLVFKVLPGQTFNPTKITPRYQSQNSFDVIFVIGAQGLNNLGSIYTSNPQVFSSNLVNIDNQAINSNFGQTNIVDPNAASVAEIVTMMMSGLGLGLQEDISTNLLTGIFDVTANLTTPNVSASSYEAVSICLKNGGKKPGQLQTMPIQPIPLTQVNSMPQVPQTPPILNTGFNLNTPGPTFDLSALIPPTPAEKVQESFTMPPVVNAQPVSGNTPSPEERPAGEGIVSESEPDWLTPKIFKGTSLG